MRHYGVAAALVTLAGCGSHENGTVTTSATDAKGQKVSSTLAIDTDAFKANVEVPGLQLSGSHVDIAGVKLYPGSTVRGMKITASDRDGGKSHRVAFDFSSPASVADVSRHLSGQGTAAGFTLTSAADASGATILEGARRKAGDLEHIRFVLHGAGAQTTGTAAIDGSGASDD